MRFSILTPPTMGLFALVAGMLFVLAAPQQAAATSTSILLNPIKGTSCNDQGPSGKENNCTGTTGSTLAFAVAIVVDAAGTNAWSIDLEWDEVLQDQLTYNGGYLIAPALSLANPSPPPDSLSFSVTERDEPTQSTASEAGRQNRVTEAIPPGADKYIESTSFRTGTVTFTLDGDNETYITLGFFRTDGATMGGKPTSAGGPGGFITPHFGAWYVNATVPEPSGGLLSLVSLSVVALLASRRRQSN